MYTENHLWFITSSKSQVSMYMSECVFLVHIFRGVAKSRTCHLYVGNYEYVGCVQNGLFVF